ncbi:hypothetical protein ACVIW0_007888 [Bradyrhizobium sp. USDA 4454]
MKSLELGLGRQMHEHQLDADLVRAALDLRETVGRRRFDTGDELEVEQQIAAFRLLAQHPRAETKRPTNHV